MHEANVSRDLTRQWPKPTRALSIAQDGSLSANAQNSTNSAMIAMS